MGSQKCCLNDLCVSAVKSKKLNEEIGHNKWCAHRARMFLCKTLTGCYRQMGLQMREATGQ